MQENEQSQNLSIENIDEIVDESLYYRTFFNKDPDYYIERYEKITAGQNVVFNGYAFFFGFLWLAYRKMYVEILALIAIMATIDCIFIFALEIDNSGLDRVINIIWAVTIGCFANLFYIMKAKRTIQKAKEAYNNTGDQLDYIEKTGGVSVIAPIVTGIFFIGLMVGGLLLSEYAESFYY
ncbi:MAG: DUF2628 domain-containing protein [Prevotella sp.]|jgi:hypothetical protein|nr:DUF2628 domain-containing protein [Prevotella sp.]